MIVNSETILANQVHPGDSTVQSVTGEQFKGDGFYNRSDGFHTAQFNLANFVGDIILQGTLATTPQEADWFDISSTLITNGNESIIKNFVGNYIWVRVKVTNWTAGSISSILLNH